MHILVCEALHGSKPPIKGITVDHITKYDGDFMRERSDNRACNLEWATLQKQRENQKQRGSSVRGTPVLARRVGCTNDDDWCWYASSYAAGKALGVNSNRISSVCNETKPGFKTAGGYEFRLDNASLEDQGDLPAQWVETPDGMLWDPAERWEVDPQSKGRTRVSTRNRVQTMNMLGGGFGPRRTVRIGYGMDYASVSGTRFHLIVWRTFCPDDPCVNGETLDHWDRDKGNNALYNLRRATGSEQNRNKTRPSADEIQRPRKPVLFWKDGEPMETAERFVGVHAAARALNARFGTTRFEPLIISTKARRGHRYDVHWRFAFVPETDEEKAAREASRARVLAAVATLRAAAASSPSPSSSAPPSPVSARAERAADAEADREGEMAAAAAKREAAAAKAAATEEPPPATPPAPSGIAPTPDEVAECAPRPWPTRTTSTSSVRAARFQTTNEGRIL